MQKSYTRQYQKRQQLEPQSGPILFFGVRLMFWIPVIVMVFGLAFVSFRPHPAEQAARQLPVSHAATSVNSADIQPASVSKPTEDEAVSETEAALQKFGLSVTSLSSVQVGVKTRSPVMVQ